VTAPTHAPAPPQPHPHVVLGGRDIPVVLPRLGDPRLRLSAVIITLQVLGQTVLGFKVSIAQILVSVAVCAVVEVAVTLRRQGVLVWPASGILTGNSVAFILRASGTRHGDWWSMRGIQFFVLAALLSLLSKYLIRPGGRHLFNPSNVGLVWCLLAIGPTHVFPQYLWWGPNHAGVAAAVAVILAGGLWVLKPVGMIPMALSFLATFGVLIGIFAAAGHSFIAIWHDGPVRGASYWFDIAVSPEVLVFVFFMMSDPQTTPKTARGRVVFGTATALVAAALIFFQPTEFGIKLAILSSLTVTCAQVPLIERVGSRIEWPSWRSLIAGAITPAVIAAAIIAIAAPADTAALAANKQLVNIERGLTGPRNAQ